MSIRVLIVDDHPAFRSVARTLLERDGFDVVGDTADASSGLAAVRRLRPAVVLLDVNLPDLNGFDLAVRLAQEEPSSAIVFVSGVDSESCRARVAASSALGFIAKSEFSGGALAALIG